MPPQDNRPSKWRKIFRRLRTAALVFILALVCAALYLNRVGLPGFIKNPLLGKLRARGIDLQVSRLRWSFGRGIVADNVAFAGTNDVVNPQLSLRQIQVRLKPFSLQISSLVLRRGEFRLPTGTNGPTREIAAHNIEAELKFLADDCWSLEHFQAEFYGARLSLAGSVTNASALRELLKPKEKKPPAALQRRLDAFARAMEQVKFAAPADLKVLVQGDARDPKTFHGVVTLHAPDVDTPWGRVIEGVLSMRLFQDETNLATRAELKLEAASAQTKWGGGTNAQLTANWIQSLTNATPISGHGDLTLDDVKTRWGNAACGHLAVGFDKSLTNADDSEQRDWSWWNKISPFALRWNCELTGIGSPKLEAENFSCSGNWSAPELKIENIHSQLYGGQIDASANLNVVTRAARFELTSDFDAQKISPLLTEGGRRWIQKFSWQQPPKVHGSGSAVLPAWTNKHPGWRAEVQPTLILDGEVSANGGAAYRGAPFSTAHTHISYSNMVWTLSDLVVTRPEGSAELFHVANDRTKDYYWKIHGALDPTALRPALDAPGQRALDLLVFTAPPRVDGEVWGRFHDYDRTSFRGTVAVSNFTFRGESASTFQTSVEMTNKFISFLEPRLSRGDETITASGVGLDLATKRIFFTNGFSTADPMAVARAIGKKTALIMAPYQFLKPPTAHVHGMIEMRPAGRPDLADMVFDVDGGPYHWNKFTSTRVAGTVLWRNQSLVLTNFESDFYGGKLAGNAAFDFSPERGTDYQFNLRGSNVDFHLLMADVSGRTNKLEGQVNGSLVVTNANSRDLGSWNGHGRVHLRDGMIWEIPVFGIFSPVLNTVVPGLGSTRVSEGRGRFSITNGVACFDDLEFYALMMRMNYRGTVDFKQNVNARVEAELLRNVWGIGPVFSTVLWPITKMFEYRITGTLSHPSSEPVYIFPKLLLMPFHPIKLMKDLLPESSRGTNAPPGDFKFADPNQPEGK